MRKTVLHITAIILICFSTLNVLGQQDDVQPQLWSNLYIGWDASDKFILRNGIAYNFLVSKDAPWSELTVFSNAVFTFHRFMEATAGVYISGSRQSEKLRSFEYRPNVGIRFFTNPSKRWMVTNLSKFEMRIFRYSDGQNDLVFRFRNRIYGIVSLNKHAISDDKNLFLFGYVEAFNNFGEEVRERFFYQFKYKLGLTYRLSFPWRFNIGVIYQDSRDNIEGPAQLPVVVNTKWILEWGVAYIIPAKKKD